MTAGSSDDTARWEALARHLTGEASPGEAADVERWIDAAPRRRDLVSTLDTAFRRLQAGPADVDVEAALGRLYERLDAAEVVPIAPARERAATRGRMTSLLAAASIVLLLVAGLLWRTGARPDGTPAVDVGVSSWSTVAGASESIRLPDGTAVLLGPMSRLSLADGYGGATRTVELNGMAMFDVVHADDSPFRVRAGDGLIEDLGTAFMVRSTESDEVRVAVTVGAVRFQPLGGTAAAGVVLDAGDRGVLRGGTVVAEPDALLESDLAWTEGRLVFEEAPFERVRAEVRRWYGVELRVDDPAPALPPLTTTFVDADRAAVLELLSLVYGATIEERGDTAILRGTPTR